LNPGAETLPKATGLLKMKPAKLANRNQQDESKVRHAENV